MKLLFVTVVLSVILGYAQASAIHAKPITKLAQQQQLALEGRIIGGKQASLGQFPWQAAVNFQTSSGSFFCGGALISDQWILTAAHCALGASSFSIRLGTTYSSGGNENTLQVINSTYAIVHENYNANTFHSDVAVIKLSNAASLNQYVQAIQLDSDIVEAGSALTVSGFGAVRAGDPVNQRLNYVQVKSISNNDCRNTYGDIISQSIICTKGNTIEGTCQGDSGGALVRYINGSPRHVGVVSFVATAGCDIGYPAGYSRTESFRSWIRSNTGV